MAFVPQNPPNTDIDFKDYLALNKCVFDWAESYDSKDWARLRTIIAPELQVDYTEIGMRKWARMSAEDFMAMVTHKGFLGDPLVKTQHLLGMTWWEKLADPNMVIGHHQLRAAHQVYADSTRTSIRVKGHGHASNEHYYRKINGVWKFAGLRPTVRWNEFEFEKVFTGMQELHDLGDTIVDHADLDKTTVVTMVEEENDDIVVAKKDVNVKAVPVAEDGSVIV